MVASQTIGWRVTNNAEPVAVSVVIPCLNAESTLGLQLDALARQTFPGLIEVVVSDNGSLDGSAAVAAGRGARVVDALGRRGPNHARNTGAAHATGPKILTCDADDVVADDWVEMMVEALEEYDIVGGMMDWSTLNPGVPLPRAGGVAFDAPRYGFLPSAAGANFGIRTDVLHALGGWDEAFEGGPDEVELCWRAQLAGFSLGHTAAAIVHYRMRATTAQLARQVFRRATFLPLLFRRFREARPPRRVRFAKAGAYVLYVVVAWPAAIVNRRWRREWVRRAALGAGVVVGYFKRTAPAVLPLAGPRAELA